MKIQYITQVKDKVLILLLIDKLGAYLTQVQVAEHGIRICRVKVDSSLQQNLAQIYS